MNSNLNETKSTQPETLIEYLNVLEHKNNNLINSYDSYSVRNE